jgi:two-component system sensor histidine kinase QseC
MNPRPWSLRRRLLAVLGASALLSWGASSVWIYIAAVHESERLLDEALDHTAHAILTVMRSEAAELKEQNRGPYLELPEISHSGQNDIVYQLLGPNGRLIFRSHGTPESMLAGWQDRGFQTRTVDGKEYRVCTLATDLDALTIHVAQPLERRFDAARAVALRLLVPGAALMLALILAVAWSVRTATGPVVRYARVLDGLPPEADAPIDGSDLPLELQPVARAIDGFLSRTRAVLLRERTLTADAAHELRNPLAALRLQAQVARRSRIATEREAVLDEMLAGVDRAARMVDAILTLAGFDAATRKSAVHQPVQLGQLARLVAQEIEPIAQAAGIRIEVAADHSSIPGNEDALAVALRNLLGNALRFARSRITVEVGAMESGVSLRVRDDGPGFDAESAARAFHRFYRGSEQGRGADGTGLGLALVLRIAQLHGGDARLVPGFDGGGGVELVFPGSVAAAAD